jgi:alkanesulfonate monooxygenase SsuD/methylene tetrahydromethanopterin reductase-like flavin-dependent oxidoreductase (luciferase family)
MGLEFGVFDHMDHGEFAMGELYANRLRLVEAYDAAGFYAYHLAEHHATHLGMAPAPGIFLSAVASRTKRLRFGPMVYVLPVHDPLRLIEEICMLDQLSGGRFELGVGRGTSPYEIAYFGVNHLESRAMFAEALEVIRAGLKGGPLNHEGRYYKYTDVPMVLAPVQKPHPPLWYGLVRPEGATWAVKNRVNALVNGPVARVKPLCERYLREWRELYGEAAPAPMLGLSRHVHVADSDREAEDTARRAYAVWFKANDELWRAFGSASLHFPATYEDAIARGQLIVGSPDTVAGQVENDLRETGANYLVSRLAFGDIPLDRVLHGVKLFANEVMPRVRGAAPASVPA